MWEIISTRTVPIRKRSNVSNVAEAHQVVEKKNKKNTVTALDGGGEIIEMTFRSGHQLFLVRGSNNRLAGGFSRRCFTAINPSQSRPPRKPTEPVATQWNVSTDAAQGPSLSSPASDPVGQSYVPLIKCLFSEVARLPLQFTAAEMLRLDVPGGHIV